MKNKNHIAIVGAGLVGSLLSIYLAKRGYKVTMFERRNDMRNQDIGGGRSINLALSNRGLKALQEAGLEATIRKSAVPMHGRMIHPITGDLNFQPYGKEGQFINSISRSGLNIVLMNEAERLGVEILFDSKVENIDLYKTQVTWSLNEQRITNNYQLIVGADGAYSSVRNAFQFSDRFNYSQHYIEHGYKELTIPADKNGSFKFEKNALHIWPRESFMLIALPNLDGSFTCTLFFPFNGPRSFDSLKSSEDVSSFFNQFFPDVVPLMPTLLYDFENNLASSLVTIQSWPWYKNNSLLIGDAAHGIVPFYGQGMNAGFEDCRVLNQLLDDLNDNWDKVLPEFQNRRKPDADAIAQLALDNFIEMRDLVDDPNFILRKKIEARLHHLYPEKWIPLYSMVTFNENMRYSEALERGNIQKEIMDEVLRKPELEENWEHLDFESIVNKLQ